MQSKEEILELYGIETTYSYNPLMENIKKAMEQYASQFQKPPFPEKMTFKEMLTNLFNTDFLTPEELQAISEAGEMYGNGCIYNYKKEQSKDVEAERYNFAISFTVWALYDPMAKAYLESGITAYGLLEKYKDRPYINTDTTKQ